MRRALAEVRLGYGNFSTSSLQIRGWCDWFCAMCLEVSSGFYYCDDGRGKVSRELDYFVDFWWHVCKPLYYSYIIPLLHSSSSLRTVLFSPDFVRASYDGVSAPSFRFPSSYGGRSTIFDHLKIEELDQNRWEIDSPLSFHL